MGQIYYPSPFTFIPEPPNVVLAGPASGSSALPTFRALVAADLPAVASASVQSLDVSTFAGADLGAKLLAAQAVAPAAGCVLDCRNLTSPQTLSTAVNITGPHRILATGLVVTQTATITLTGNNSGVLGTPGRAFIFNKGANLAQQIIITGNDVVVDNVTLNGAIGSGYTGNGIQVTLGALRPIISNSTITGQFTDAIHDLGSTDLDLSFCDLTAFGVNGFNATSANTLYARIVGTTIVDSATSTGNAVVVRGGIFLTDCRILTSSNNVCVNNIGSVTIVSCFISNTGGNSCYTASAHVGNISSSTLSGGGTVSAVVQPCVYATQGTLTLTGNTIQGAGVGYAVHADSLQNGNLIIAHNQLGQSFTSQGYAIIWLSGDSIGMVVHHNSIIFADNSPTGVNYGIWLQTPNGAHCIQHRIEDNIFRAGGGGSLDDIGILLDNTTSNGVSSGHIISRNSFVDMTVGIARNDPPSYMTCLFEENTTNTGPIFQTPVAGGTLDVIISHYVPFTVATLPVCGAGSEILVSDGLPTSPVRAGAGYYPQTTIATPTSAGWAAMTSPVVAQVNLTAQTATLANQYIPASAPFYASGQYLLTWNAKLTTVGSVSSTLGQMYIMYTDPDGTAITLSATAMIPAGTFALTSAANTVAGAVLIGMPLLLNVKQGARILYSFVFAQSGSPAAQYNLNICLEIR